MVDRHEHERLAGPAAEQAHARLREYGRHMRFQGKVPPTADNSPSSSPSMTRTSTPAATSTCAHNPDRAMCHNGTQESPSLGDCQPLACRNVALTTDNLNAWQERLATVDTVLADDSLAPYVRDRLHTRQHDISRLLTPNSTAQDTP